MNTGHSLTREHIEAARKILSEPQVYRSRISWWGAIKLLIRPIKGIKVRFPGRNNGH